MIIRRIICDCCNAGYEELKQGDGFPSWGAIEGVVWNGVESPKLCPRCLSDVMEFLEKWKAGARVIYGVD